MQRTLLLISLTLLLACRQSPEKEREMEEYEHEMRKSNTPMVGSMNLDSVQVTYKVINGLNGTYGYDIYIDEKLTIHQPHIPAVQGNEGFKTSSDAEKVAQLVIQKMKATKMLPEITVEEMKKLQVIQ